MGLQVFISVAFILGDGLFNIIRIVIISVRTLMAGRQAAQSLPVLMNGGQHVHSHATEATGFTDTDAPGTNLPLPAGEEGGELYIRIAPGAQQVLGPAMFGFA